MKIDNGYHIFNDSEMVKHDRIAQRSALYRGLGLGAALMAVLAVGINDFTARGHTVSISKGKPVAAIAADLFKVGDYVCKKNKKLLAVTAQPNKDLYEFKCKDGARFVEKVTIVR